MITRTKKRLLLIAGSFVWSGIVCLLPPILPLANNLLVMGVGLVTGILLCPILIDK